MERMKPGSFWYKIFALFSGFMFLLVINQIFHLNVFGFKPLENSYLYYVILLSLSLTFLYYPATPSASKTRIPWYDVALFLLTVAVSFYLGLHGLDIVSLGWEYDAPLLPSIFSVLLWILVFRFPRLSTNP